jgi:hypothetical protein
LFSLDFWKKITATLVKEIVQATGFTAIDGLSIFDKVLLHEVDFTKA